MSAAWTALVEIIKAELDTEPVLHDALKSGIADEVDVDAMAKDIADGIVRAGWPGTDR